MADSQGPKEPKDGALELREIAGEKLYPKRHTGAIWRVLFEWDGQERRWYILTQWYKCPVCSRRVGRHIWPETVTEALVAYEAKVKSEETRGEPPRVLDRRD